MAPILSKGLIPGNIIIDCKPILHVIKDEYKGIHCDQCLKKRDSLKKCSICQQLYYCDKNCQTIDWKRSHKIECNLFSNPNYNSNHFSWRETLLLRLWLQIKSNETFVTKRYQLLDSSNVCLNDIEVNVKDSRLDIERMVTFRLLCNRFKAIGLKFDRKQLFHWFCFVSTNPSINAILYYSNHLFCIPIAVGIYIQMSCFTHSCNPNSAIVTNGLSTQVRAMKMISIGEEITISYIDLAKDKSERQALLKKLYYLNCNCDKCELNLDSTVNYSKFNNLFKQLMNDSITMHSMSGKHDWIRSNNTSSQLLSLYRAIYGDFYPQLTLILMLYLDVKIMVTNGSEESLNELYKEVDRNIKITHGENHQLYKQFLTFCNDFKISPK